MRHQTFLLGAIGHRLVVNASNSRIAPLMKRLRRGYITILTWKLLDFCNNFLNETWSGDPDHVILLADAETLVEIGSLTDF